ncbi:MAG: ATPase [Gammaproteobacteria bacterium]|nr:ATPase [Gammaproteobacteria bacterium]
MKFSVEEFRDWQHKNITLLGMSGVGKTRLSNMLPAKEWFHFSGDYRIGTHYLDEPILDNITEEAMQIPFLKDLLRSDSIYIENNITVNNLQPVSSFLGKLGDPEKGGLSLAEFKHRQELHREAEIDAMRDVPIFIRRAQDVFEYQHFINDAGGSVCELDDEKTLEILAEHTLILYIKATEKNEKDLIERAISDPKPLYYREAFLDEQLANYMQENDLEYVALVDPDEFVRWIFPKLFYSRIPRYDAIANKYGYTITTEELSQVNNEKELLALIETAIARQN